MWPFVASRCDGDTLPIHRPVPGRITVADLLPVWLAADHPWKPSTLVGYPPRQRIPCRWRS